MSAIQDRNLVLRFDMRSAPHCPDTVRDRYKAAVDMARWADQNSIDVVGLSEHHDTEDGFLSAPLTLAGMMLSNTSRVRVVVSALLVPLHDPLRLAEDITLLDLAGGGRFSATCGLGYREEEYCRFGIDWSQRGKIFDDKLSVLVPALKGEAFQYNGSSTQLNPAPDSPIISLLLIGGNSKAAARRAARYGLLFSPAIDDPELDIVYRSACEEYGNAFGFTIFPRQPATTFLAEDPLQGWQQLGDYLLYDAKAYGAWKHPNRRAYAESFATNLQELQDEGKYRVLTPEQALSVIESTGALHLAPLTGGVPLSMAWDSLRLFEDKVQPYLS